MGRWGPLVTGLILAWVTTAGADCAWVLWVDIYWIGVPGKPNRTIEANSAYPHDGYQQCIEDVRTRADRHAEGSRKATNVKNVSRTSLMGAQQGVTTELKSGGTTSIAYKCLPHPVQP
jgi:hypothetical protein